MTITYKIVNIKELTVSEINYVNSWIGEAPGRDIGFLFSLVEDKRSLVVLAYDKSTLVASSIITPASFFKGFLQANPALVNWLLANNIPISNCTVPSFIYVKSSYRGAGIGDKMTSYRAKKAIELGYTHSLLYGYETANIFSYGSKFAETIHTGVTDKLSGYEILLRKHSSYLK